MRYYIDCPYAEKDEAKGLGARFDFNAKKWYFEDPRKAGSFAKWLSPGEPARIAGQAAAAGAAGGAQAAGAVPEYKFRRFRMPDFVVLDTETTGLADFDEVIELAVVAPDGETLYESLFEPRMKVNPGASAKNGLTNARLKGEPRFIDEWGKILRAIGGRRIFGHNIAFDARLVKQTLRRYGGNPDEAEAAFRGMVDTMALAKKYVQSPSYGLEKLANMLGVHEAEDHRAASDCRMTIRMMQNLDRYLSGERGVAGPGIAMKAIAIRT